MKQKHALFIFALVFYEMAIYLSMDAYTPALPDIATVFGITASLAQFTATAWMLGGFLVQLIFGPLADRHGRRPILLWGAALYIIASIGCSLAPNIHIMMLARVLQGIAMPSMFIAGYAVVNELFDSKEAVHTIATMNSIGILAPAFGPIFGGALLLFINWRWIFVILAAMAVVTGLILFKTMPETMGKEDQEKHRQTSLKEISSQYWALFTNGPFMNAALTTFLPLSGMVAWMIAGPFIVIDLFHHNTLEFGAIQAVIFGCFIIGMKVVKHTKSEDNFPLLVNLGLGANLLGSAIMLVTSHYFPHCLSSVVIPTMLVALGGGLSLAPMSRLTLERSDAPMGSRMTVFSLARVGSGVLGSAALALIYNHTLISMAWIAFIFAAISMLLRMWDRCVNGSTS